jgi:metal-responsive CopG/Arc/MetJ family transcriptional regulator
MNVVIEIDEKLIAEIDSVAKDFNKNRSEYITDSLKRTLRADLRKRNLTEEEVRKMFKKAYGKFPIQPEEFEIEDEQMEEFWKQV